jgi:nitronate monooxygenase
MWPQNKLTDRLNLKYPILQAPMAELVTPQLAAEVSNAGGLGALGMWGFPLDEGVKRIKRFRALSDGRLNINYPLWHDPGELQDVGLPMRSQIQKLYDQHNLGEMPVPTASACQLFPDHLEAMKEEKPDLISFHFGLPDKSTIDTLKSAGICIISSATTVAEAKILEAGGVDFIIAQGSEAGGHRGTFSDVDICMQSGLFALLPQVVDAVKVPVIAAGGISDGRGIAAAMMLGASGVQIGTAFLRCNEANVDEVYQAGLRMAEEAGTVVTNAISGRNARFIKNAMVDTLSNSDLKPLPFPAQYKLTLPLGNSGDKEYADLLAGQSVALSREMPAAKLMETLVEETNHCLGHL